MPAIKRERGDSSSDGPDSTPTKNKTSFSTKKPRSSSAPSSSSPAKSRLPLEAKRKIAEEIVRCGAGLVDVDKLVREVRASAEAEAQPQADGLL